MKYECDVAIVGSGPYALSLGAHLRARNVQFRIFGPPMRFWRDMPAGINLKSLAFATNVYVPVRGHTFQEWCRTKGLEDREPCTMESFATYGMTVQRALVSDLEPVEIAKVSIEDGGFSLVTTDERRLTARRVVFATGLTHMAQIPEVLSGFPGELVSHTFDLSDFSPFRGKDVAVVGAGASAIEAGALVHEAGGSAQILVREAEAVFHGRMGRERSLFERIRYPQSVLGPGLKSRAIETVPFALHLVPDGPRVRFVKKHLGPAAPWWIKDRVEGKVPIVVRTQVTGAERVGDRIRLHLLEHGVRQRSLDVDHVIAGTGYVANIDRLAYLDTEFKRRLRRLEEAPALSMSFESSVRGAYFIGPITALSFGPLFRFVAGAGYAAPALARHLAGPSRVVGNVLRRMSRRSPRGPVHSAPTP